MGVFLCECVETANVAKRGRIFPKRTNRWSFAKNQTISMYENTVRGRPGSRRRYAAWAWV